MLFGLVVFSNCAHYAGDLYRLDLKSFANKLLGYSSKLPAKFLVGISHGLPYHHFIVKR